jgi:cytochrome c-type biogenesis protein CcmH
MWFWILAVLLILVVVSLVALALLRKRTGSGPTAAQYDLQVYRDQLKDVERDQERGVISPQEAARIKTEVSRRVLEADKAVQTETRAGSAPKSVTYAALLGCLVLLGGSLALYREIGAPGYPDLPLSARLADAATTRADRPTQAQAEAALPETPSLADPQ